VRSVLLSLQHRRASSCHCPRAPGCGSGRRSEISGPAGLGPAREIEPGDEARNLTRQSLDGVLEGAGRSFAGATTRGPVKTRRPGYCSVSNGIRAMMIFLAAEHSRIGTNRLCRSTDGSDQRSFAVFGGTIQRNTFDKRSRDATRIVWLGGQSPMSKSCDTMRAPGRSSRRSFGRNRRLSSGER
jgi:hypothetical protein